MKRRECPLVAVSEGIRDGDLLLFRARPGKPLEKMIATVGRAEYCHAEMAAWWGRPEHAGTLMSIGIILPGGRASKLANLVTAYPGVIDWYAVVAASETARRRAVQAMLDFTGTPYGWWTLAFAGLAHSAIGRFFVPWQTDDLAIGARPTCSAGYALAWRSQGYDPVPNLADNATEPADLARSTMFEYQATLVV
jgi:hypothetical protein